jgi:hypothetical protein
MTGSQLAKAKEDAAAIMRAKQAAGEFFLSFCKMIPSNGSDARRRADWFVCKANEKKGGPAK